MNYWRFISFFYWKKPISNTSPTGGQFVCLCCSTFEWKFVNLFVCRTWNLFGLLLNLINSLLHWLLLLGSPLQYGVIKNKLHVFIRAILFFFNSIVTIIRNVIFELWTFLFGNNKSWVTKLINVKSNSIGNQYYYIFHNLLKLLVILVQHIIFI